MDKPSKGDLYSAALPKGKTGSAGGGRKPEKAGVAGANTPPILISTPTAIVLHQITDEQLSMLENTSRDGVLESFWFFAGTVAGTVVSAIQAVYNAYFAKQLIPLSIWDLLQVVLFGMALIGAIITFYVSNKRGKDCKSLIDEIRQRKRVQQNDSR